MDNKTRAKLWRQNNIEQARKTARKNHLLKAFNLTVEQYDHMFEQQNGLCAICGNPETTTRNGKVKHLAVDHDWKTGKIRALLCARCNTAVGSLGDNLETVYKVVTYLNKHNERWSSDKATTISDIKQSKDPT